jgi:hypothetical protein
MSVKYTDNYYSSRLIEVMGASQNVVIARSEERVTKQSQVSIRRLLLPPQRTNPPKRNRNGDATIWDTPEVITHQPSKILFN